VVGRASPYEGDEIREVKAMKWLAAVMVVVALGFFVTRWAQGKVTLRLVTFSPTLKSRRFLLSPLQRKRWDFT